MKPGVISSRVVLNESSVSGASSVSMSIEAIRPAATMPRVELPLVRWMATLHEPAYTLHETAPSVYHTLLLALAALHTPHE